MKYATTNNSSKKLHSSKEKRGFCSKEESGFCSIAKEKPAILITRWKEVNFMPVAKENPVMYMAICITVRRKGNSATVVEKKLPNVKT